VENPPLKIYVGHANLSCLVSPQLVEIVHEGINSNARQFLDSVRRSGTKQHFTQNAQAVVGLTQQNDRECSNNCRIYY
jgi:hypothetical protein